MSADQQTAIFLGDKMLAKAMTSDLEKVEGKGTGGLLGYSWYFKEAALIDRGRYTESGTHTHCGWKGDASYFNYEGEDGKTIKDIAWFYPTPMKGAEKVAGRVAFYIGKVPDLKVGVPPVA